MSLRPTPTRIGACISTSATAMLLAMALLMGCKPTPSATQAISKIAAMPERLLGQEAPNLLVYPGAAEALELATVDSVETRGDVLDGGWFQEVGPPPIAGSDFGTYGAKGDLGVGEVELVITLPAHAAALIVPVVTGPAGTGSVFKVVDMTEGAVVGALEEAPGLGVWRLWALPIPQELNGKQIRVTMSDTGAGWGEWGAIGPPAVFIPLKKHTAIAPSSSAQH